MKVLGYSISLNVLILIGILYLIMVVNALSSSCSREGRRGGMGDSARDRRQRQAEDAERARMEYDRAMKRKARIRDISRPMQT